MSFVTNYQAFLKDMPIPAVMIDVEAKIKACSPLFADWLQQEVSQFIDSPASQAITDFDWPCAEAWFSTDDQELNYGKSQVKGIPYHVTYRINSLKSDSGEITGFLICITDYKEIHDQGLTPESQTNQQEEARLKIYQATESSIPIGLLVCTTSGDIIYFNRALEKDVGFCSSEVNNDLSTFMSKLFPDSSYREETYNLLQEQALTTSSSRGTADPILRFASLPTSGSPVPMELRYLEVGDSIIIAINDASFRHFAEETMRQSKLEALDALKQLQETQKALVQKEKLASLGEMVSGVSHELNTPIGSALTVSSALDDRVKLFANLLKSGKVSKQDIVDFTYYSADASALITRSLQQAERIVSQFKQVAVDTASERRRKFNLNGMFQEIIFLSSTRFDQDKHNIHIDIPKEIEMDSYPGPLSQIISNMIDNSLLHGFENKESGEISITGRELPDNQIEIIYRDNGKGIPENNHDKIFNPFFTTKLGQGGSGIGMSVTFNIVTKVLNGLIELGEPEEGVEFTITLPIVSPIVNPEQHCIHD